jgi:hypothetical protein
VTHSPPGGAILAGGAAASPSRRRLLDRTIAAHFLVTAIIAVLAVQQLILWRFIGFSPAWLYFLAAIGIAALCTALARAEDRNPGGPTLRCLLVCLCAALPLFALGGEGRFFYANPDWMVRDAVLRDMIVNPWPFSYTDRGVPELLRAPIGMYLMPALVGKVAGFDAAHVALLIQNSLFLALILALGSQLFGSLRDRFIALSVFLLFSGMDVLGTFFNPRVPAHLEGWAEVQFSSHVTQVFWVPQHALAGWLGALLYLLWADGRLRPASLLTAMPVMALWSPLSLMGVVPFAAHVAVRTLRDRAIRPADIALPATAAMLALPALTYMQTASDAVGARIYDLPFLRYLVFELLETVPYILAAYAIGRGRRFAGATLAITALILVAAPYGQIGYWVDFAMRASIPALAILSVIMGDLVVSQTGGLRERAWRGAIIVTLAIGTVTPLSEIRRSLVYPPSPPPLCNVYRAAMASFGPIGVPTYLAPLSSMAGWLRPAAVTQLPARAPPKCWARPWPRPQAQPR